MNELSYNELKKKRKELLSVPLNKEVLAEIRSVNSEMYYIEVQLRENEKKYLDSLQKSISKTKIALILLFFSSDIFI